MHRIARTLGRSSWVIVFFFCCAVASGAESQTFDVILSGGQIIDGTGAPPVRADIGIIGDTIVSIGDLTEAVTNARIDVTDRFVVPGFIDIHNHADGPDDNAGLRSRNPKRRAARNLVSQGITTVVVNQDGRSPQDIARQKAQLAERGMGVNVVLMVGHNTIRRTALKGSNKERPATEDEIEVMKSLLRKGMDAGAFGMTAGLEYEPGIWSTTEELIALVEEIVPYRGVYIVHERSSGIDPMWVTPSRDPGEQPTMLDNIHEVIEIGESTGATVVVTHIKARGVDYWGKSGVIIETIEDARARGVNIYADQYPYTSSGSDGSVVLLPYWILEEFEGDNTDYERALLEVMKDPLRAKHLENDVRHSIQRRGGADRVLILRHPDRSFIGKSLAQIAYEKNVDPVKMVYLFQIEGYSSRFGGAILRGFSMDIEDVQAFARQPWVATASDAGIALPEDGLIHARYYGTFPRKINQLVREKSVLTIEEAVRTMTGLPAEIMGFTDRGLLREGGKADITVIDLEHIRDRATYFSPHQYAEGINFVFVNGTLVVAGGTLTNALPGVVITPKSAAPFIDTDD
jgi:N-acyl-D-amino-acid deacylase